jgi:hypothetical protein
MRIGAIVLLYVLHSLLTVLTKIRVMIGHAPLIPSLVSQASEAHTCHDMGGATCHTLHLEAPHLARGS